MKKIKKIFNSLIKPKYRLRESGEVNFYLPDSLYENKELKFTKVKPNENLLSIKKKDEKVNKKIQK